MESWRGPRSAVLACAGLESVGERLPGSGWRTLAQVQTLAPEQAAPSVPMFLVGGGNDQY